MIITGEQDRQRGAHETLRRRFGADEVDWAAVPEARKYLGALRRTPARMHNTRSLGQALAFLRTRGGGEAKEVYEDLNTLVLARLGEPPGGDLLERARSGDFAFLARATDETVAVVSWMVRYLVGAGVRADEEEDGEEPESGAPAGEARR